MTTRALALNGISSRWSNWGLALLAGMAFFTVAWGPMREAIWWLATRPEIGNAFLHPRHGREDAWQAIMSFLLLTPVAALAVLWALVIVYALPAGLVIPLGKRYGLPEWVSTIFVATMSAVIVYAESDLWLAPTLRGLGLLARAGIVVFQ